jgi:dolichol-phosphate mannosyltransferase
MGQVPAGGYAVIVILLLTIGGLIILMLGILGEYVWRIYDELRGKPLYIVDKVIERVDDGRSQADRH